MKIKKILGSLIVGGIFALLFGATVLASGWLTAILVWSFSIGIAALLFAGFYLLLTS